MQICAPIRIPLRDGIVVKGAYLGDAHELEPRTSLRHDEARADDTHVLDDPILFIERRNLERLRCLPSEVANIDLRFQHIDLRSSATLLTRGQYQR